MEYLVLSDTGCQWRSGDVLSQEPDLAATGAGVAAPSGGGPGEGGGRGQAHGPPAAGGVLQELHIRQRPDRVLLARLPPPLPGGDQVFPNYQCRLRLLCPGRLQRLLPHRASD